MRKIGQFGVYIVEIITKIVCNNPEKNDNIAIFIIFFSDFYYV